MSNQILQRQNVLNYILRGHVEALKLEGSPYVEHIESYYTANPFNYREKIMAATWIPYKSRIHIIQHIAYRLDRKKKKKSRRTFSDFLNDPTMQTASTKKFRYYKVIRSRGGVQIVKRSKATGQIVKMSESEKSKVMVYKSKQTKVKDRRSVG